MLRCEHNLAAGSLPIRACFMQMLREIFLTLVGRQGDRDALDDATTSRGVTLNGNQPDDDSVLKGLRAECRWAVSPPFLFYKQ